MRVSNKSSNTRSTENSDAGGTPREGEMVDVLYQKMGNRWYAFSLINDEVFFGSLTEDEIHGREAKTAEANLTDPSTANDVTAAASPRRHRGNA